jgi:DNA polymerase-3 subunit beta
MKFSSLREDLLSATQISQYSSSPKGLMPILSGVKIEGKQEKLMVNSTDLESYTSTECPANVSEAGECVVNLKVFSDLLRDLKEDKIDIRVVDNEMVVEGKNTLFKLYTMPTEDFPSLPSVNIPLLEDLESAKFLPAVSKVSRAASRDEKRPTLLGILVDIDEDEMRMVSTDSYRLAIKMIKDGFKVAEKGQYIIPSNALANMAKIAGKSERITVFRDENNGQVRFDLGNTDYIIRLIEGKFPKYGQFIPEEMEKVIEVEKEKMESALKRVSLFSNTIRIKIEGESITMCGESREIGEGKEKIGILYNGEDTEIAFNSKFFEDGMACIEGETMLLGITEPLKPGIIKEKGNEDFSYVIMPIRL